MRSTSPSRCRTVPSFHRKTQQRGDNGWTAGRSAPFCRHPADHCASAPGISENRCSRFLTHRQENNASRQLLTGCIKNTRSHALAGPGSFFLPHGDLPDAALPGQEVIAQVIGKHEGAPLKIDNPLVKSVLMPVGQPHMAQAVSILWLADG